MKKFQLVFSVLAVAVDYGLLVLAGLTAYFVRYNPAVQEIRPVIFDLPYGEYLNLVLTVGLLWLIIFALVGLYHTSYLQRVGQELARVFLGCSLGFLTVVTFLFWSRELFSSRFIMLAAWLFAVLYLSLGRLLLRWLRRILLTKNLGITNVVIIGQGKATDDLVAIFYRQPVWGFRVRERFALFEPEKIESLLKLDRIDEIILADPDVDRDSKVALHDFCIQNHLGFRYVADMFDAQSHNIFIQAIGGIPVVEIKKTRLEGWGRIAKRTFDLLAGFILLILFLPLLVLIAVLIKIDSRGPVIYLNERVGKNGRPFKVYKFRRLIFEYCTGAAYDDDGQAANYELDLIKQKNARQGGLYKVVDDPRSTRVGKILEKYSLDELPQVFNVLKGEMSLVGPRPHQSREVEKFPKNHERVLAIKPGITGLAQISGRSDLNTDEELRLDTLYIENWSLLWDISILLKTPLVLFKKRKFT